MNSRDVVIVEGARTPFAKSGTKLRDVHAAELGRVAMKGTIARANLDVNSVDEVILGNAGNPSDAVNIARVVALNSGIPKSVSSFTVHRNCASALEAVSSGYERIKSGTDEEVLVGGSESMSQMPLLFTQKFANIFGELAAAKTMAGKFAALSKLKLKYLAPRISIMEGLRDPFTGMMMGDTAELLAKEFKISRREQDEFALRSHQRAVEATKAGRLQEEIVPLYIPPKFSEVLTQDVGPRDGQTMEALGKLKPFFDKKNGTVTVGNSCPITDGAAVLLLMSREKAKALGFKPLVSIKGYAFAGLEPERMGLGPVYATAKLLKKLNMKLSDIGLIELNEAFAAQVLACEKAFASKSFAQEKLGLGDAIGEVDPSKLNVNGGAIALGHPVGATGSRLVLTLMKEMNRRKTQYGLATLCIGGGQGGSIILEREA
ncbi:MAG: acetyl-CoA acyltransferase [Proteobacteria bacterium SG_bin7]|nr:MAG: acetyl-CoA acyltransferase [Proteobacteria bacterium SG_bin7]